MMRVGISASLVCELTDDVVVLATEELQAPEVGAELLELEGELDVLVRLDAVEQRRVGLGDGAALQLLPGNHVHLVVLHPVTGATVHARAHDVQLVADLWVQHHALARHKSVDVEKRERQREREEDRRRWQLEIVNRLHGVHHLQGWKPLNIPHQKGGVVSLIIDAMTID